PARHSFPTRRSSDLFADHHRIADGDAPPVADGQVVLVNATTKIGDLGQLDRIRRALDQRGMLFRLPESLEATLDQRNVLVADLRSEEHTSELQSLAY